MEGRTVAVPLQIAAGRPLRPRACRQLWFGGGRGGFSDEWQDLEHTSLLQIGCCRSARYQEPSTLFACSGGLLRKATPQSAKSATPQGGEKWPSAVSLRWPRRTSWRRKAQRAR